MVKDSTIRSAVISDDGVYRYRLTRKWGSGPTARWVMLNPSTADAYEDDQTIRKVVGFSKRAGYGVAEVYNLFAYRSTDPDVLRVMGADAVGPANDRFLSAAFEKCAKEDEFVIVAWGAHPEASMLGRDADVLRLVAETGAVAACLTVNSNGSPGHPCMIGYNHTLDVYDRVPLL